MVVDIDHLRNFLKDYKRLGLSPRPVQARPGLPHGSHSSMISQNCAEKLDYRHSFSPPVVYYRQSYRRDLTKTGTVSSLIMLRLHSNSLSV